MYTGNEVCKFGEWSDWRPRSSTDQCNDQNRMPYEEVRTRSAVRGGCRVQLESREVCCPWGPWSTWSPIPGSQSSFSFCPSGFIHTKKRTRAPTMGNCEMNSEKMAMCVPKS